MSNNGTDRRLEGWLLKRSSRINGSKVWNERYFTLSGNKLSYHLQKGDLRPRNTLELIQGCVVSDVYLVEMKDKKLSHDSENNKDEKSSKKKKEFRSCIKISWPGETVVPVSNTIDPPQTPNNPAAIERSETPVGNVTPSQKSPFRPVHKRSSSATFTRLTPTPSPRSSRKSMSHISMKDAQALQGISTKSLPEEKIRDDDELEHFDSNEGIQRHYNQQLQQRMFYKENEASLKLQALKKANKKKQKKIVQGGGLLAATSAVIATSVLTMGTSLVAGLVVVGVSAAAGGGSVAGRSYYKHKNQAMTLTLSFKSRYEAEMWKTAIEAVINNQTIPETLWGGFFETDNNMLSPGFIQAGSRSFEQIDQTPGLRKGASSSTNMSAVTRWIPVEGGWAMLLGSGVQALRIFREDVGSYQIHKKMSFSVKGGPCPPLKSQLVLNSSALNAFMCLMSYSRVDNFDNGAVASPLSGLRSSFRIIERIDDNTDIIHLFFRPLFLFPSWTAPRDFCITRYWRFDDDGSYTVCYDSVIHPNCPPCEPYVRGELHGVYSIAPQKRRGTAKADEVPDECLLTHIVQVDPRGWVPTFKFPYFGDQGYGEAFAVSSMLQMLDLKDALDLDRFVPVSLEDTARPFFDKALHNKTTGDMNLSVVTQLSCKQGTERSLVTSKSVDSVEEDMVHYDFSFSGELPTSSHKKKSITEGSSRDHTKQTFANFPKPLSPSMWAEPDANSFKVRGKHYKKDKLKFNAGKSVFRLVAVDLVEVSDLIRGSFCAHPKERLQQALARECESSGDDPDLAPFYFVINMLMPGPPFYHMVYYYAVDDVSNINGSDGTPFSKLANEFFFGKSDEFRDNTFKLIPQIVDGNFIVRRAVGSTPAILGTKLKQYYFCTDRYFELMLDISSSSVAAGVVRLSVGYAKTLVVDMAFLLEGNDESTLPEKVMGCCRLKNVDMINGSRFCEQPEEHL